jgi:hypothetical protein
MNDTMSLAERADALEHKMMRELDAIIVKSRLFNLADGDMSIPNGPALLAANPGKYMLMGDDPRLPNMPERPSLMDFFKYRFGPANHLLQSARHAVRAGMDEKVVMACLVHDIGVIGFIRADHGYWGAQMVAPYVEEEVAWAIRAHQALRFYPGRVGRILLPRILHQEFRTRLSAGSLHRGRVPTRPRSQMVHDRADDHSSRHLFIRSERDGRARGVYRHCRAQLQAAERGARLGQQPVCAYVAHADPPDPIFVSDSRRAWPASRSA